MEFNEDAIWIETPAEQVEAIAARFKALRLSRNVKRKDLAQASGVSVGTIGRFEAGGNISLSNLATLCTFLGYPLDAARVIPDPEPISIREVVQPRNRAR